MRRCLNFLGVVLFAVATTARADTYSFTTQPDTGNVSGIAGSTVGWGYSITNNSASNFVVLTGIDSDLFLAIDGTPDASIFDFPVLAPLQTITEQYDPIGFIGLFQFTWNSGVPVGTTETGAFSVQAQFCDAALSNCGGAISESADYTATVSSSGTATIPEPTSAALALVPVGLCITIFLRRASTPKGASNHPAARTASAFHSAEFNWKVVEVVARPEELFSRARNEE